MVDTCSTPLPQAQSLRPSDPGWGNRNKLQGKRNFYTRLPKHQNQPPLKESNYGYLREHRSPANTATGYFSIELLSDSDFDLYNNETSYAIRVDHIDDNIWSNQPFSSRRRWKTLLNSIKVYHFLPPDLQLEKSKVYKTAIVALLDKYGSVKGKTSFEVEVDFLDFKSGLGSDAFMTLRGKKTCQIRQTNAKPCHRVQIKFLDLTRSALEAGEGEKVMTNLSKYAPVKKMKWENNTKMMWDIREYGRDSETDAGGSDSDGLPSWKRSRHAPKRRRIRRVLTHKLVQDDRKNEENIETDESYYLRAVESDSLPSWKHPPHVSKPNRIRKIFTDKFIRSQKTKSQSFISDTWCLQVNAKENRKANQSLDSEDKDFHSGRNVGKVKDRVKWRSKLPNRRRKLTLGDFYVPPRPADHQVVVSSDSGGIYTDQNESDISRDKTRDVSGSVTMATEPPQSGKEPKVDERQSESIGSSKLTWDDRSNNQDNSAESLHMNIGETENSDKTTDITTEEHNNLDETKPTDSDKMKLEEVQQKKLDENEGKFYVRVKLDRMNIRPDQLKAEFRRDYLEADCKPRRFVLNISRLVYHRVALLNRLRCWRMSKADMTTYLIFAFRREVNKKLDEYRVWISSTWWSTTDLTADDMFASALRPGQVSIGELIQSVVSAVDAVDVLALGNVNDSRQWVDSRFFLPRPGCTFFLLTSMTKWCNGSFQLPHATEWFDNDAMLDKLGGILESDTNLKYLEHDIREMLDNSLENHLKHSVATPNRNVSRDFEIPPSVEAGLKSPTVCSICLADLSGDPSRFDPFPLALQLCSHWFCEKCWQYRTTQFAKAYINTMENNRTEVQSININKNYHDHLKCLKKSCKASIGHATLLTILDLQHIRSYNKHRAEILSRSTQIAKPCPNPQCDRILYSKPTSTSKNDYLSFVTCKCSTQACLACLQSPHWPASCASATRYHQFLTTQTQDVLQRPLEDRELPDIILRGKPCPNCGRFLQTANRSAKSEHCECGCQFCVRCGREIKYGHGEDHESCQEVFVLNDVNFKKSVLNQEQTTIDVNVSKWYTKAIEHRKLRHPQVISALYSMSDILALKILEAAGQGFYIGDVKKSAAGWREKLLQWNKDNKEKLSGGQSPRRGKTATSVNAPRPLSRTFSSLSNASAGSTSDTEDVPLEEVIRKATRNLTHVTLELHHVLEYTCVLLDEQPDYHTPLLTHMERAEDICSALAILLQESHVHNANRILPAFVRLEVKAKQVWGNIITLLEAESSLYV